MLELANLQRELTEVRLLLQDLVRLKLMKK